MCANFNFNKLWVSQMVGLTGIGVANLAVPMFAMLELGASAFQMGLIGAVSFAPFLLLSLFAGVVVDRFSLRNTLVCCDIFRFTLFVILLISMASGSIDFWCLYLLQFFVGIGTLFSDLAQQSFLPTLMDRGGLLKANGKLETARSFSFIVGPSLAGVLTEFAGVRIAISMVAICFLLSVPLVASISVDRKPDKRGDTSNTGTVAARMLNETVTGLRFVLVHPVLRPIALKTALSNGGDRMIQAVYLLFLARTFNLDSTEIGFILSIAGAGVLVGALLAPWLGKAVGIARAALIASFIGSAGCLFFPIANLMPQGGIIFLIIGHFLVGAHHPLYNVAQVTIRQSLTPSDLLGRMNATMRFFAWGAIPLGWLIGGFLGELLGLWETIIVGSMVVAFSGFLLLNAPFLRSE